jgi:class 3 adenylate cyclase
VTRQKDTLAVLFADVSDSTRLYENMGDTAAFTQVRECLQILNDAAQRYHGRVVKTIGDGAMCAFTNAEDAALASIEMQDRIDLRPPQPGKSKLTIRIGFHYGNVLREGDDVFGDTVNVAARMSGLAVPGQILMTAATAGLLSPELKTKTRRLDALAVKGKAQAIDIHELQWQDSDAATLVPGRMPGFSNLTEPRLRLKHQGKEIEFRMTVTIGREPNHDIVILDKMASRNHARIEKRLDKFALIDQSANGTYVTISGRDEIMLRREEFILYGSGQIAFGESPKRQSNLTIVEFHYESPEERIAAGK